MIKYKHAPIGFIAQFFTDEKLPYPGAPDQEYRDNLFMGVTGDWCPTLEGATESVKAHRPKEVKKLQKKLEKKEAKLRSLEEKVADLKSHIARLQASSTDDVKERD